MHDLIANPYFIWVVIIVCVTICAVMRRLLRTINIVARGWPPPHVDADGDIVEDDNTTE